MNRNILFYTMFLFTLLSCSDSDNETEEKIEVLLPKVITGTETYNHEPGTIFTSITTFNYDEQGRPIEIVDSFSRLLYDETEAVLQMSSNIMITYHTDNKITMKSESIYYAENNETQTQTVTRKFSTDNSSIIHITLNDNSTETIELENGLAAKYTGKNFVKSYVYDTKENISQFSHTWDSNTSIKRYTYDDKEGTFKNINIPQWFFIVILSERGRINNIKDIDSLVNGELNNLGTNAIEYNNEGYPVKIDFFPNKELIGMDGNTQTIEYEKVQINKTF